MRRRVSLVIKRGIDLLGATLLLVVSAPVMIAIALAIKMESPGPVFFRQERAGRDGRPFLIFKLRSMVREAERNGPVTSMQDPRVTRVGRVLRRLSLDELPQLLNVLRGEMSLVGPRPLLSGTTQAHERRRLDMRPGLTSLVEIRRPHLLSWDQRMECDVEYVDRWSLWLDLGILIATVPAVFTRRDILDLPRTVEHLEDHSKRTGP